MKNQASIKTIGKKSKAASLQMAKASLVQKNGVLKSLKELIDQKKEEILFANQKDLIQAEKNGLSPALLERLSLDNRIEEIMCDIENIIKLDDPIGIEYDAKVLPNGLHLSKRKVPLGVLGIIFESRPNITIDISALAIKSGNTAILRGGSEALQTNQSLIALIQASLQSMRLPEESIQLVQNSNREEVREILQLDEYIDLIIPRGSAFLQKFCRAESRIPLMTGGIGICHLFVDERADLERSLLVILNAKTDRPSVCNSLDTLLIHSEIAKVFLPKVINRLKREGVSFCLDPKAFDFINDSSCRLAGPDDWDTEWLSLCLGIKVVENLEEAIGHIQRHSTAHSDGILTESQENADRFTHEVDSAAVYINASTRFTDGGQFGLGSEVAVSTQKFHARGPMGLNELTSYKWMIRGSYQVRNGKEEK